MNLLGGVLNAMAFMHVVVLCAIGIKVNVKWTMVASMAYASLVNITLMIGSGTVVLPGSVGLVFLSVAIPLIIVIMPLTLPGLRGEKRMITFALSIALVCQLAHCVVVTIHFPYEGKILFMELLTMLCLTPLIGSYMKARSSQPLVAVAESAH